jgi:hypothetical protein
MHFALNPHEPYRWPISFYFTDVGLSCQPPGPPHPTNASNKPPSHRKRRREELFRSAVCGSRKVTFVFGGRKITTKRAQLKPRFPPPFATDSFPMNTAWQVGLCVHILDSNIHVSARSCTEILSEPEFETLFK